MAQELKKVFENNPWDMRVLFDCLNVWTAALQEHAVLSPIQTT
jgi:hypothetical protein